MCSSLFKNEKLKVTFYFGENQTNNKPNQNPESNNSLTFQGRGQAPDLKYTECKVRL